MTSTIGIEITDIDNDFICGKMPVDERTIQPFGLLHSTVGLNFLAGNNQSHQHQIQ